MNSSLHIIFKRGLGMMLVFEFCKGAGKKVKASVCLELWQGLVAFNLTRPALPSPRAHPLSLLMPGVQVPAPLPMNPAQESLSPHLSVPCKEH